ncbi:MAG: hypothetical protein ABI132_09605 [Rhodanobacteraceae bacterium]
MISASDRKHEDFATTRWSLVRQLDSPRASDARNALAELALHYWYPIYAYVRQCGHAPAAAQDITRTFLQQLIRQFRADPTPPRSQFRAYLLARLHAFLAGPWHELIDADTSELGPVPADLEERTRREHAESESPEQAYQRSFALAMLAGGFKRLRKEAVQTGHLDMYEALEPYLARDPAPGQYQELAQRLGSRPLALVVALKRLRQRFRELIAEELADTVATPEEMLTEQRAMLAALDARR